MRARLSAVGLACSLLLGAALVGCGDQEKATDACPHLEQLSAQRQPYSEATLNDIIDSTKGPFDDNGLTVDADHAHATAQALNAAVKGNTSQVTSLADQLDGQMFQIAQDCSKLMGG